MLRSQTVEYLVHFSPGFPVVLRKMHNNTAFSKRMSELQSSSERNSSFKITHDTLCNSLCKSTGVLTGVVPYYCLQCMADLLSACGAQCFCNN